MRWRLLIVGLALAASPTAEAGAARLGAMPDPLLAIDSLFYVENRGLTRILVTLNAHRFKLVTDPAEVTQGANAFLIPRHGAVTFDIGALLAPDDENPFDDDCNAPVPNGNNCIEIVPQGPEGADAQVVISDVLLAGEAVAFVITPDDLEPLPQAFALLQSYPNPFADAATITYTIPESRTTGLPVSLVLYDVAGRRVRTLVEAQQYPGTFRVVWDGTGAGGRRVASGLYLCRLVAGDLRQTITLTLLR